MIFNFLTDGEEKLKESFKYLNEFHPNIKFTMEKSLNKISAVNKGQSMINYHQSLGFDCPNYSCNDHCNWSIFQEIFFLLILYLFPQNSFE